MVLALDHADHHFGTGVYVQKEKVVKKGIAFFDFDGTITTKDTLLEFIRFAKGSIPFYIGFLLNSPYLVAYKLKIISNQLAKEKVLRFFFQNTPLETFRQLCADFTDKEIPKLLRPKAIEEIYKLKKQGYVVVIVSASPENWISTWAKALDVELIASQLEIKAGMVTGKIIGKNCHGEEKVRRIMEKYVVSDYDDIYAYGDTSGDRPMLKLAKNSFYRPFRN
jgi:HAD superfamily hydrolase (TIGR01490 family)